MKITAVTDPDTALAFRLAGVETVSLTRKEEAGSMLEQIASQPEMGIVLITERLARAAGQKLEKIAHERHLPLFIEIPDLKGSLGKRVSAAEKMAAILRR